jgi:hypothetical protein
MAGCVLLRVQAAGGCCVLYGYKQLVGGQLVGGWRAVYFSEFKQLVGAVCFQRFKQLVSGGWAACFSVSGSWWVSRCRDMCYEFKQLVGG